MAKTKISEYSSTSADNTDISNINIAEGCSPANVNNAIRTLMAQIKNLQAGTSGDTIPVTAGGTGSTTASAARTALSAAASGANSDITSLSGLTTPLSVAQGGYTGANRWQFVQFGDYALASNGSEKIQYFDLNSSTDFADLAAAAPVAKYITIVRDFVVAANIGASTNPSRVNWSDINDPTDWTAGGASQSDFQELPDGGDITGITGGEFGIVFLEKAIVRMSYIGSPLFFQFDTISRNVGCIEGGSIAQYGGITYFLSDEGFYSCNGQQVTGIGAEKVDRYFFKNANIGDIDSISTAVDPERNLVIWNYANISGGRSLLIYNFETQKWSEADTDVDFLSTLSTTGTTLDGIDSAYNVTAGSFVVDKQYTIRSIGTTDYTLIGAVANTVGVLFTATGVGSGTGVAIDMAASAAAFRTIDTLATTLDDRLYAGGNSCLVVFVILELSHLQVLTLQQLLLQTI